jgi:hypothetical protein
VHEVDDPRPRADVLVAVEAAATGRNAALTRHADHLGHHEPRAADAARAQVHEVEVARRAVHRAVHVHRRDDDAVVQLQLAQAQRHEHRRPRRAAVLPGEGGVDVGNEARIAQLQLAVGDAPAAGQQIEREDPRRLADVARDALEPFAAAVRRALGALDDRSPLALVGRERRRHVGAVLAERPRERDRVLDRELRPRADREVRGVRGVPEQDDVLVPPGRVAQRHELDPARVVREQRMAGERVGEQLLAEREPLGRRGAVEPGAPPRLLGGLHDERAHRVAVRVAVDLEHAVLGLGDVELEGVEHVLRAEPDVLRTAALERRAERGLVAAADRAVDAVGADDEIGVQDVGCLGAEAQVHAELRGPALQDVEQQLAAERGEAVAPGGQHLAAVVHVDLAPAREPARDLRERGRVGRFDRVERLVGEDDAEAEGVVRRVALVDAHVVRRVELLDQEREVEPCGTSTGDRDPHGGRIIALL